MRALSKNMHRSSPRTVPDIIISKELREYLVPLSAEEFSLLEENVIKNGCREPLVVWEQEKGKLLLIDGHNRYTICTHHSIPFDIRKVKFRSMDDARMWMVDNQLGRRNLTTDQLSYYRGLKYLSLKKSKGGYDSVRSKGMASVVTSDLVATQFNVSPSTIKRDAKFAQGLNVIGRSNPALKRNILAGKAQVKKADIQLLGSAPGTEKIVIKNEADLYNKAKRLRETILDDIESHVRKIDSSRQENARKILAASEPLYPHRSDRLRKIKGSIISAINRAINKNDVDAIEELRKLVDRLANELSD